MAVAENIHAHHINGRKINSLASRFSETRAFHIFKLQNIF